MVSLNPKDYTTSMHFYHKFLINFSVHLSVHPVFYLDPSTLVYTSTIRFYKFSYISILHCSPLPNYPVRSLPICAVLFVPYVTTMNLGKFYNRSFSQVFIMPPKPKPLKLRYLEVITTSMVEMQQMFEEHLELLASISLFSYYSQNPSLSLT